MGAVILYIFFRGKRLDFRNGFRATRRSGGLVLEQARCDPSSSRFDIAADTFDLGLAGSDAILQRISRGQDVRCSFLEFERTFRTNLIFAGLHAIDCAALAWRHIATVFLDVASARSFELFDPGIQLAMVAMKNLNMTNFLNTCYLARPIAER